MYGDSPVAVPPRWYKDNNFLIPEFRDIKERVPGREYDFTFNVESSSYGDYACVSEKDGKRVEGQLRLEVKSKTLIIDPHLYAFTVAIFR